MENIGNHRLVLLVILSLFVTSCKNRQRDIPLSATQTPTEELVNRILEQGDLAAYNELSQNFNDSPNSNFLYVALITANKYEYPPAFLDVYICLSDLMHKKDGAELDDLDSLTRKLALEYLSFGAALREKECMEILARHLQSGRYMPKDSIKAIELLNNSGVVIEDP